MEAATYSYCYILEQYYIDHPGLEQILDVSDASKHNIRTHVCFEIKHNNNKILIPLRKSLGNPVRAFGKIGFSVPSKDKPNAGLDYRYIMVVNDDKYIRYDEPRIPKSQQKIIEDNYDTIKKEAVEYINSYINVARKQRVQRSARFRKSSLINFHQEFGLDAYNETPFEPQEQ